MEWTVSSLFMDRVLNADKRETTFTRLKWPTHLDSSSNFTTSTLVFCVSKPTTTFALCNNAIDFSNSVITSVTTSSFVGTGAPLPCNQEY